MVTVLAPVVRLLDSHVYALWPEAMGCHPCDNSLPSRVGLPFSSPVGDASASGSNRNTYSGISSIALVKLPTGFCTHASCSAAAVRSDIATVPSFHKRMALRLSLSAMEEEWALLLSEGYATDPDYGLLDSIMTDIDME